MIQIVCFTNHCPARHLILAVVSSHAKQDNTRKLRSPECNDITFECAHYCRLNYRHHKHCDNPCQCFSSQTCRFLSPLDKKWGISLPTTTLSCSSPRCLSDKDNIILLMCRNCRTEKQFEIKHKGGAFTVTATAAQGRHAVGCVTSCVLLCLAMCWFSWEFKWKP